MKFKTIVLLSITFAIASVAYALPELNSWQQNFQKEAYKRNTDWIFLVNRGWFGGDLIGVDEKNVTIKNADKNETFPRSDVSVMFLSDFLDPQKRTDKNEIKLRIELTGTSECGSIGFSRGTIIKNVDSAPKYTHGDDKDDTTGVTPTCIWFEKRDKDRSETTVSCDVTLLLANAKTLYCDIHDNRMNGSAGQFTVRFLNPQDGNVLMVLKNDVHELWENLSIPVKKLRGVKKVKLDSLTWKQTHFKKIKLAIPTPINAKNDACVKIINDKILRGSLVSVDAENVVLKVASKIKKLPRNQVISIELYDWVEKLETRDGESDISKPIRISFAGTSSTGQINLASGEMIHQLIMPPHFLRGDDSNDIGMVLSERSIGFDKPALDRTTAQIDAIVTLKLKKESRDKIGIENHYTNILAGNMDVIIYDAISGKKIMKTPSKNRQNWSAKFPRSKLLSQ